MNHPGSGSRTGRRAARLWLGLVGWGVNRLLLTPQRRLFGAAGGLQEARP